MKPAESTEARGARPGRTTRSTQFQVAKGASRLPLHLTRSRACPADGQFRPPCSDPNPRIAQAIQQDLAAVGITAEIKSLDQAAVIGAAGEGPAPMIWSGGMAWIADFPDPANFYYGILGCVGAVEGGWNWSKYCNKDLDARAAKADALVKADQMPERSSEWTAIFDDVMKDAPWAPVFNEKRFTYHSARLGGDPSLFTDPIHIPVNYDYIYAKDVQ